MDVKATEHVYNVKFMRRKAVIALIARYVGLPYYYCS